MSLLKKHRKEVQKGKKKAEKEYGIDEITSTLVENTTQLAILKKWAATLGVPDANKYNGNTKDKLRKLILEAITERKIQTRKDEDDTVVIDIDEDDDLTTQYQMIEKFMKSYLKNAVSQLYGAAGTEFLNLWRDLPHLDRKSFILEYFNVNNGVTRISPIRYLIKYKELLINKKTEITPEELVKKYLNIFRSFNDLNAVPRGDDAKLRMHEIETSPLFPQEFLIDFRKLDSSKQFEFAKLYTRNPNKDPYVALKLFNESSLHESPDIKIEEEEKLPVFKYLRKGVPRYIPSSDEEREKFRSNRYDKCLIAYRKQQLVIQPGNLPGNCTGEKFDNTYFVPTDEFFSLLCKYRTVVPDQTDSLIELYPYEKSEEKRNLKYSTIVKKVSNGKLVDLTGYQLKKIIKQIETNNIFIKIDPIWLLKVPTRAVDEYLKDYPYRTIDIMNKETLGSFLQPIRNLQKNCQEKPLIVYYTELLTLLFPFLEFNPPRKFWIVEQFEKGYITSEGYTHMSLDKRIPEIPIQKIVVTVENFVRENAVKFIQNANTYAKFDSFVLNISDFTSIRAKCPKLEEYDVFDIITYIDDLDKTSYCFTIPELLIQFSKNDTLNKYTGTNFSEDFVRNFLNNYRHLNSERFRQGDQFIYPDKKAYNFAHPMPIEKKEEYNESDIAGQFDKIFETSDLYPEPVGLIMSLMKFEMPQLCNNCDANLSNPVHSIIDQSDGTYAQISFCDYGCMNSYKFKPLSTVDELIDYTVTSEKLIDLV